MPLRRLARVNTLTAVSLAVLTLSACSRALDPALLEDAQLTVRVRTALVNDQQVGVYPIEVTVQLARVTLSGHVATEADVQRAIERARSVAGVREVISSLSVDPTAGTAEPSTSRAAPEGARNEELIVAEGPRPGLVAIGGSMTRTVPGDGELQSALGVGPLLRLGSPTGLGVGIGFSWFTTDLEARGSAGHPGTLKIRPLMAGVAYTAQRGRSSASLSLVSGWAFNSLDMDPREAGSRLAIDVDNSLAARIGVSVWVDLSHRVAFNTFVGYLVTRPRVTFVEAGRFETRTVPADVVIVSAGLAYKLF